MNATSGGPTAGLTMLRLGSGTTGASPLFGSILRLTAQPIVASDAQLRVGST